MIAPEWQELKVKADIAEIDRARDFIRERLHAIPFPEEDTLKLELALHEIFVNISLHAYPDGGGYITLRFRSSEGVICIEIRDRGIPFDPDKMPPLDLEKKIRSGTSGGFGVYLFKTLTDKYSYEREGEENVITIRKRIP